MTTISIDIKSPKDWAIVIGGVASVLTLIVTVGFLTRQVDRLQTKVETMEPMIVRIDEAVRWRAGEFTGPTALPSETSE